MYKDISQKGRNLPRVPGHRVANVDKSVHLSQAILKRVHLVPREAFELSHFKVGSIRER